MPFQVEEAGMSFEEMIREIEKLAGRRVEATIWGPSKSGYSIATLVGTMRPIKLEEEIPPEFARAVVGTGQVFQFGDDPVNALNLYSESYISASRLDSGDGVEVILVGGVVRICERRPWVD